MPPKKQKEAAAIEEGCEGTDDASNIKAAGKAKKGTKGKGRPPAASGKNKTVKK